MCFAACQKPDADLVQPLNQSVSHEVAPVIETPDDNSSSALTSPDERKKQNIGLITIDVRHGL